MKDRYFIPRQAFLIAAFLACATLFVSGLNYLKFEKVLRQTQDVTLDITGRSLVETVEFALDLGMRVDDLASLKPKIVELVATESTIRKATLTDVAGLILLDTSESEADANAPDAARASQTPVESAPQDKKTFAVINNFGERAAALHFWKDNSSREKVLATLLEAFLWAVAQCFACAAPIVLGALLVIRRKERETPAASLQRLQRRLLLLSGCIVTAATLYVSALIFNVFEREVRPLMEGESAAIARAISSPLARSVESGFALAAIPDIDQFFEESLKLYPQVLAVAVRQSDGWSTLRMRNGASPIPLRSNEAASRSATWQTEHGFEAIIPLKNGDETAAWLHVVTSPDAVIAATTDARWDIAVLILVSLLIIFEIFRFAFRPGDATASADDALEAAPAIARLALFLFVMADQFSISFIVVHARELAGTGASTFIFALPIIAFAGAIGLSGSLAARLIEGSGAKRALAIGAAIAAAGFLLAFATTQIALLVVARLANGVGYAIVTLALQSIMSKGKTEAEIKRNLGSFTTAIMTGCVCGAATGGVLAERIGYHLVFLGSAILALAPLLFIPLFRHVSKPSARGQNPFSSAQAMRIPQFMGVLCLVAIPAKIVLGAFVFYLAPLLLKDHGLSEAAVARNVMLYALCMVPAISIGDWLTRRGASSDLLLIASAFFTVLALVVAPFNVAVALAVTGACQGLASVPMLGKIPTIANGDRSKQTALFALLRSGERVGSMIGPAIAAVSFALLEPSRTPLPLAALCLVLLLLLIIHILAMRRHIP
jgi:predicted MFS family arabinose efflux permease